MLGIYDFFSEDDFTQMFDLAFVVVLYRALHEPWKNLTITATISNLSIFHKNPAPIDTIATLSLSRYPCHWSETRVACCLPEIPTTQLHAPTQVYLTFGRGD